MSVAHVKFISLEMLWVGKPIYSTKKVSEEVLADLVVIGDAIRKFESSPSFKVFTYPISIEVSSKCCVIKRDIVRLAIEVDSEKRVNRREVKEKELDEPVKSKILQISNEFFRKVPHSKWGGLRCQLGISFNSDLLA